MGQISEVKPLDSNPVIHFAQLESIYNNNIVLNNPVFSDHEKSLKDVGIILNLGFSIKK
jgi:hypothetical protein